MRKGVRRRDATSRLAPSVPDRPLLLGLKAHYIYKL